MCKRNNEAVLPRNCMSLAIHWAFGTAERESFGNVEHAAEPARFSARKDIWLTGPHVHHPSLSPSLPLSVRHAQRSRTSVKDGQMGRGLEGKVIEVVSLSPLFSSTSQQKSGTPLSESDIRCHSTRRRLNSELRHFRRRRVSHVFLWQKSVSLSVCLSPGGLSLQSKRHLPPTGRARATTNAFLATSVNQDAESVFAFFLEARGSVVPSSAGSAGSALISPSLNTTRNLSSYVPPSFLTFLPSGSSTPFFRLRGRRSGS